MDLGLDVEERDGFAVLSVRGEVDVYTAPRFRERLIELGALLAHLVQRRSQTHGLALLCRRADQRLVLWLGRVDVCTRRVRRLCLRRAGRAVRQSEPALLPP